MPINFCFYNHNSSLLYIYEFSILPLWNLVYCMVQQLQAIEAFGQVIHFLSRIGCYEQVRSLWVHQAPVQEMILQCSVESNA